jgi:hypothetical protein
VVASDAFFPSPTVFAAIKCATAVIQPGGSVRDDEVIAAADARNIAMVFTARGISGTGLPRVASLSRDLPASSLRPTA